jgi:hypothetical protein
MACGHFGWQLELVKNDFDVFVFTVFVSIRNSLNPRLPLQRRAFFRIVGGFV